MSCCHHFPTLDIQASILQYSHILYAFNLWVFTIYAQEEANNNLKHSRCFCPPFRVSSEMKDINQLVKVLMCLSESYHTKYTYKHIFNWPLNSSQKHVPHFYAQFGETVIYLPLKEKISYIGLVHHIGTVLIIRF